MGSITAAAAALCRSERTEYSRGILSTLAHRFPCFLQIAGVAECSMPMTSFSNRGMQHRTGRRSVIQVFFASPFASIGGVDLAASHSSEACARLCAAQLLPWPETFYDHRLTTL